MIGRLKRAISKNNIDEARSIMREMLWWNVYPDIALKKVVDIAREANIFDEHDGRNLIADEEKWNEDYLDILREKLLINFSEERFVLAYEVAKKLNKDNKELNNECPVKNELRRCCKMKKHAFKIGGIVLGASALTLAIIKKYNK